MLFITIFVSLSLISLWVYLRRGKSAMRALRIFATLHVGVAAMIWGGPLSSGALFLLLPAPTQVRQSRVVFDRTSPGTSYLNAMFVHTSTPTGYYGARLGWTGRSWALRFLGGELAIFQACDSPEVTCALISVRDHHGNVARFRRANLFRMSLIRG